MSFRVLRGDLTQSRAEVLVVTVNCGIPKPAMGRGIARWCRDTYPRCYEFYREACRLGQLKPGVLLPWRPSPEERELLLFPTKVDWRAPSRLEWIEQGLQSFVRYASDRRLESAAFPALGCGNGNLSWDSVRPLMERYLEPLACQVLVYHPWEVQPTQ